VAVVAAGGGAALAATGQDSISLVTAAVTTGSVTQTVDASGTIASSAKTDVTFPANGTVAEVDVKAGDTVKQGQVLAKLDTSTLHSDVDTASARLASARQQLADDESGQTSAASSTGSTAAKPATGSDSSAAVSPDSASETALTAAPAPTGSTGGLQAAQKAVVSAQRKVDAGEGAIDRAQQVIDAAVKTNAALRDAQKSACDASTTDPSACASARADYEAYADTLSADTDVLDTAIRNQDGAVKALNAAIGNLDALLGTLSASSGSGSTGSRTSSGGSGGTARTAQSTQSSASTGQVASAAQLAADAASIDSAKAQLTLAKQSLAAATLTSPLAGTVGDVSLSTGSGSSGGSITIVGTGNQVVTVDVPLSQIDEVKTGQPARIAVDGRTRTFHGTVTKIGMLSSTSGSLTTFPVTITLADGSPALPNGVGADVTITTGTVSDALLVPNSAISTVGSRHTVIVVRAGRTSTATVTLGLTGLDVSQVTGGLSAGENVLLADPGQGLPSSATSSTSSRFGGRVLPAGVLPAGGFVRLRSGN
jgi:HlyD family secretion protein